MNWPKVRDDLALITGYHSPQVEVKVRLNTNESPYAPPERWMDNLQKEISEIDWNRYPDRGADLLKESLASFHGVKTTNIAAGNGSNEILQSLFLAYGGTGRSVGIFEPTFPMHSYVAKITGTNVITAERNSSFKIDEKIANSVLAAKPELLLITSPNNPTGIVETEELINFLLEECTRTGALLIVDEAYSEFSKWSATELIADDRPVVVTKTFSKTWSMASVRLGYMIGPEVIVEALDKVLLPYHLDSFQQVAGRLALEHVDEMNERVEILSSERERVATAMSQLPIHQWESGANFILFKPNENAKVNGQQIWESLLERSILIRNFSSFPRLEGYLRVTIGAKEENSMFLSALKEILE